MTRQNFYHTIQKPAMAEHKDRNSRFIAFAFPVNTPEEARDKLKALKKEHPKANHHCFAYRIGVDGNNFRVSDDGEPSGTAGRPVLGQIDSKGIVNVMIVVVRYFGGTLLGVPGLIQAYKTAASLVLQLTPVIQEAVTSSFYLSFDYTVMNEVLKLVKQYQCDITQQEQSMFCSLTVNIPVIHLSEAMQSLQAVQSLDIRKLQ